jgi:rubredoxin
MSETVRYDYHEKLGHRESKKVPGMQVHDESMDLFVCPGCGTAYKSIDHWR